MARVCLIPLLALMVLFAACSDSAAPWHGRNLTGLMPDLAFHLGDEYGRTVTAQHYRGKVVLLYFGFTHCEDVCPATLTTLSSALRKLGGDAEKVRILFVSVDPRRDTPTVLLKYARHFAPQLIAVTGSDASLQQLARRYRVTYSYGKADSRGDYEVYHSSAIFVFDAHGKARLLLDQQLGATAIAADLQRLIS